MLTDRSEGYRREITGIVTVDDMRDALSMLEAYGVVGDAEIHSYLHVGWTGRPEDELEDGVEQDPEGRSTSLALWARAETELIPDGR